MANMVYVSDVFYGLIEDIRIAYGANGVVYGSNVNWSAMNRVFVAAVSNHGFDSEYDNSGENYFTDFHVRTRFTVAMNTGWYVSRSTASDIGAMYMIRVTINAINGTLTNGAVFTRMSGKSLKFEI